MLEKPFGALPGGPLGPLSEDERRRLERETPYQLGIYFSDLNTGSNTKRRDQVAKLSGDHLAVLEIDGPDLLAIRLGAKSNPFFPMRPGMVIARPFDVLTVRTLAARQGNNIAGGAVTQALLLASYGRMILDPGRRRDGFQPGFFTTTVTAGTAYLDLLDQANWPFQSDPRITFGRFGGTLRIHNRDVATPVYVYSWSPPAAGGGADLPTALGVALEDCALRIDPGQKEEFRFESSARIFQAVKGVSAAALASWARSICVQTAVGTAKVAATFSTPLLDLTTPDAEAVQQDTGVSLFT